VTNPLQASLTVEQINLSLLIHQLRTAREGLVNLFGEEIHILIFDLSN
jgi:hypothetical protein